MAWNAPKPATTTLADLRRCTPWLWVYCERCQHRSPAAMVPLDDPWSGGAPDIGFLQRNLPTRVAKEGAERLSASNMPATE
jgi:hypothetical protein